MVDWDDGFRKLLLCSRRDSDNLDYRPRVLYKSKKAWVPLKVWLVHAWFETTSLLDNLLFGPVLIQDRSDKSLALDRMFVVQQERANE